MRVMVTGSAGFIAYHLCQRLIAEGHEVAGIDNMNAYYDTKLKEARLHNLLDTGKFHFDKCDICDTNLLKKKFDAFHPDLVINLAAQAGVRHSIDHPQDYTDSNLVGFANILERVRRQDCPLIYASSSSVYGDAKYLPVTEWGDTCSPISYYGATKKANEVMAESYSNMYGIAMAGLRFFTVYAEWGRPDMALFKFTKAILEGEEIELYGMGEMSRSFTYVDDIVDGILLVMNNLKGHEIYNIGGSERVTLTGFVNAIQDALGIKAKIKLVGMQDGDVRDTWASNDKLAELGYEPKVGIAEGVRKFIEWYKGYYG